MTAGLFAVSFAIACSSAAAVPAGVDLARLDGWDIVVAPDAIASEIYAAEEFQKHLALAGGPKLPIVREAARPARHVFVGPGAAMRASPVGFETDSLGGDGGTGGAGLNAVGGQGGKGGEAVTTGLGSTYATAGNGGNGGQGSAGQGGSGGDGGNATVNGDAQGTARGGNGGNGYNNTQGVGGYGGTGTAVGGGTEFRGADGTPTPP